MAYGPFCPPTICRLRRRAWRDNAARPVATAIPAIIEPGYRAPTAARLIGRLRRCHVIAARPGMISAPPKVFLFRDIGSPRRWWRAAAHARSGPVALAVRTTLHAPKRRGTAASMIGMLSRKADAFREKSRSQPCLRLNFNVCSVLLSSSPIAMKTCQKLRELIRSGGRRCRGGRSAQIRSLESGTERASMSEPILIKRYGGSRLYNATRARYVTLDELRECRARGIPFEVRDAAERTFPASCWRSHADRGRSLRFEESYL
jgi:hypothetical protein